MKKSFNVFRSVVPLLCIPTISILLVASQNISLASAHKPLSSYDPQVKDLLSQMTLEEKIGQMTQAEHGNLRDITDVEKYYLGSLLSGGSADPNKGNSLQPAKAGIQFFALFLAFFV